MPLQSSVKVNSIVDLVGTGPVELTYGASVPSGKNLIALGNVNITGVSTIGIISATSMNVSGVLTATSFVGNGSNLSGLPVVSSAKAIAIALIS